MASTAEDKSLSREKAFLLVIFLAALALRLVCFGQNLENPLMYSHDLDEAYYIDMGSTIADGNWLGEDRPFFMDPLYGYLLGGVFGLFGDNLTTIRLIQILLDSLNIWLIYLLGTRMWNRRAALAAAVLYSLYKVAFFYSLLILKTTLATTVSILFAFLALHAAENRRTSAWFFLGLFGGLIAYLRSNLLLYPLVLLAVYLVAYRPTPSVFLKRAAVFCAGFLLLLAPGAVRNHWVSGEWVFLNTQSGRLLYSSNNPDNLSGYYGVPSFASPRPRESEKDFHAEAEKRLGRNLTYGQVSKYWRNETFRALQREPKIIYPLLVNKLKWLAADYEMPVNHSVYVFSEFAPILNWPLPSFAFALALGAPGLAVGIARRKEASLLLVPVASLVLTMLLFYVCSRFRMPAVPFLLVGCGIGLERLFAWIRQGNFAKAGALLSVSAAIFVTSMSIARPPPDGFRESILARAYWAVGAREKAVALAEEATARFPSRTEFPLLLGIIALVEHRVEDAVRYSRSVLSIDPENATALHHLAVAYLQTNRPEKALQPLRNALAVETKGSYLYDLGRAYEGLGETDKALKCYQSFLGLPTEGQGNPDLKDMALERLAALKGAASGEASPWTRPEVERRPSLPPEASE